MSKSEHVVVIKSFKHKGLKEFFESGSKAGIQAAHAKRIARLLDRLNSASEARDMDAPGYDFHPLKGNLKGFYSIHVNGNWTIIFRFEKGDANEVNLIDYH